MNTRDRCRRDSLNTQPLSKSRGWSSCLKWGWSGLFLLLAACSGSSPVGARVSPGRKTTASVVMFAGTASSPSCTGVDVSLHRDGVNRNPRSNPNHAWDSDRCFTIMAHGLKESAYGPVLVDEREPVKRLVTARQLAAELERMPRWHDDLEHSECLVLYSCNSGAATPSGFPAFAARLASYLKMPVVAPTNVLWMSGGRGSVAGGGRFEVFYPEHPLASAVGLRVGNPGG